DDAPTHLSAAAIASLHAGQVLTVPSSHGEDMLVARIAATNGWAAVTEQPRAKAFAYSRGIQTQALAWIAVSGMLALVAGLFLAENINHPVQALVDGANRLARGEFGHRIEVTRAGELGRLSHAFNLMGAEIERRDAEIRAWSQELQRRVEERTAELREAQVQLIRSQRISAVSGLGAGMAHEINNPLAGVLGLAQILSKKLQNRTELANELRLIRILEGEALRIRDVVCTLRSLTESYGNKEFSIVDVHGVLDSALEPFEGQLQADGVVVQREFAHPMPPVRGNAEQLRQVFINLFQNARTAMKGRPGQLRVATSVLEGAAVKVAVSDSGKGIEIEHLEKIFDPFFTTKDDWAGEGLGLTIAHRVVEQHEGQIKATSVPGQGTTMTITLPAAVRGTMLI
ncbi:MAG: sensor histidine kinase, partial [Myxococcales bacterium]